MITFNDLHEHTQHLLFKGISGSQAYGLALPHSDVDMKGVFVLPQKEFYGLQYTDQLNNESNDLVYYELKKFVDLLVKNNPNILELLSTPDDCVLYRHAVMNQLQPARFLSRLCNQTFAGYASAQIKKARGLNKKIVNPGDLRDLQENCKSRRSPAKVCGRLLLCSARAGFYAA